MVSTFGQVVTATLAAEAGGALGIVIEGGSKLRRHNLVWVAAGAMLAVTCLDMLPDSYPELGATSLLVATISGGGLIAALGKIAPTICPACDLHNSEYNAMPAIRGIWFIALALSIHCALDGVGFVAADNLNRHHDVGLLIGLSLHKLPEGLALTLLLLRAGFTRRRAFLWTIFTESFTLVGAGIAAILDRQVLPVYVAGTVAFVGGGFLYLVAKTVLVGPTSKHGAGRFVRLRAAGIGFLCTALVILLTR